MHRVVVLLSALFASGVFGLPLAQAQSAVVNIHRVDDSGVLEALGVIRIVASPEGVSFTPALQGLPPGPHGFHIHENPSCEPGLDPESGTRKAAFAAGAHLDPHRSGVHRGPRGEGHIGDLPVIEVDTDGSASKAVLAPRLRFMDLEGRALIIHAGPDNYADEPQKLGGSGARIACGVVKIMRTAASASP